jgi:hypothetical protein
MHFFHPECFIREKAYKAFATRCAKINREQFFFIHEDTSLVLLLGKIRRGLLLAAEFRWQWRGRLLGRLSRVRTTMIIRGAVCVPLPIAM